MNCYESRKSSYSEKKLMAEYDGKKEIVDRGEVVVLASDFDRLQRDLATARAERDVAKEELHAYKVIIQQTDKAIIHNVSTERDELKQQLATARAQVVELAEMVMKWVGEGWNHPDKERAVALRDQCKS